MTTDPRQAIAATLADQTDPYAPLRVLEAVFTWSAAVLEECWGGDESGALDAALLLDDALSASGPLLAHIPALLSAADLGPPAEQYLSDRRRDLADATARLDAAKNIHAELGLDEDMLRSRLAEHEDLHRLTSELRRLERLARALDDLVSQREVLERRIDNLRAPTDRADSALLQAGAELVRLTDEQLQAIAPATRDVLARAAAATKSLQEEQHRSSEGQAALEQAIERANQLRLAHDQRARALAAYANADREVANALAALDPPRDGAALEQVVGALDEIENRLRKLDTALQHVLEATEQHRDAEQPVISWGDETA